MSARALWFGPVDRPLFGWLHSPSRGQVRGGMVLCPTLGVEGTCTRRTLQILATQLETAGWLVLRFDYQGTGDSAGDLDDGELVASWRANILVGLNLLREAGVPRVALVGLRIGATLAATAAVLDRDVHSLVLWDPCVDGRAFLKEHRTLRATSIGDGNGDQLSTANEGGVEILGAVLPPRVASDLDGLCIPNDQALAERTLILTRRDRPRSKRLLAAFTGAVEWDEVVGQAELVDVLPSQVVVPHSTLDRIAGWLDDSLAPTPASVVQVGRPEARLTGPEGSGAVVERPVRMGPAGLFGVRSEPVADAWGRPVIFLNAGQIDHVGPGRLWVDLARKFSAAGIPTLRFDLSGLGDSPTRPGQPEAMTYPLEAMEDIESALQAMANEDPAGATLIGLCSGAYHAIESAITLADANVRVEAVCAVNPILHFDPPTAWGQSSHTDKRRAVQPFRPWIRWLRRFDALARFGELRVPPDMWWLLDKLRLQPHPAHGLEALADRHVPTLLICGEVEARHFQRRARRAIRRLCGSSGLRLEILTNGDHTLLGAASRRLAAQLISEWILEGAGGGRRSDVRLDEPALQGPDAVDRLEPSLGPSMAIERPRLSSS